MSTTIWKYSSERGFSSTPPVHRQDFPVQMRGFGGTDPGPTSSARLPTQSASGQLLNALELSAFQSSRNVRKSRAAILKRSTLDTSSSSFIGSPPFFTTSA